MQYTKVRDQQLNLAARRQEADSRSVASRRSDFKRKRKLSYNNVVEKKKKKNNRNNNNTNDEIAAVKDDNLGYSSNTFDWVLPGTATIFGRFYTSATNDTFSDISDVAIKMLR